MTHLRMSPEELRNIQQRIAAQSKVYTHRMRDEPVNDVEPAPRHGPPRKNGRPRLEDEPRPKRDRRQIHDQSERVVLKECQRVLEDHPRVGGWWRVNVGAAHTVDGRYVKFAFVGASDLMGFSTSGRFIACEVKATRKRPTEEQQAFLDAVNNAGGLGVWVDHASKLAEALKAL